MTISVDTSSSKSRNYSVFIDELNEIHIDAKVAIVTNPTVASYHLQSIKDLLHVKELHVVTIEDGEEYKNMQSALYILDKLFEKKFNRHSVLIALGGGVIGDITGFCASIYQRGIEFIQIPTTLLAQVDASVGGKTGINNKYGKNLIGAFYQPSAVYCETRFLKTLPKKIFYSGIAEMIKVAVVYDKEYFNWIENNDLNDEQILSQAIAKSIQIKAKIVSLDEKEKGLRAILNYGHTFAHVIELESKYGTYLHGEAVSIGMMMANTLACKLGILSLDEAKRIENLLCRYDLPTTYKIANINTFYESFFLDKKSLDDNILFILPCGIGGYRFKKDIPKDVVLQVLKGFL